MCYCLSLSYHFNILLSLHEYIIYYHALHFIIYYLMFPAVLQEKFQMLEAPPLHFQDDNGDPFNQFFLISEVSKSFTAVKVIMNV